MIVRDPCGHSSIVDTMPCTVGGSAQYLHNKYVLNLCTLIAIPQWEWGRMQAQQQLVEYEMYNRLRSFW